MQGKKNYPRSQQNLLLMAKMINRIFLEQQNSTKYLAALLTFQTSVLLSILRSFYRSGQLSSYFGTIFTSISSIALLKGDAAWTELQYANIIRFTILILHCSAICLAFILAYSKNGPVQQKNIEDILSKILAGWLVITVPILLFCAQQVTTAQDQYSAVIDIFNIVCCLSLSYFLEKINGEVEYGSNHSTKTTFGQHSASIKNGRAVISCMLILLEDKGKGYLGALTFAMFAITAFELRLFLNYPKYTTSIYQNITEIRAVVTLAVTSIIFSIVITGQIILQKNAEVLFVFLCFCLYGSFTRYQQHKRTAMLIHGIDAIQSEMTAISYALQLIRIQQPCMQGHYEGDLIVSLILQNHSYHCAEITCLCRSPLNFITRKKLFKEVAMEHIQNLSRKFPSSFGLKFIGLGYELSHCDKFVSVSLEVHRLIKLAEQKKISLENYFLLEEMAIKIQKKFADHAEASKSIHCENIFKEDLIKVEVLKNLGQLVDISIRKYKLLGLDCSILNKIEQYTIEISKYIRKVEQSWIYLRSINSFSFEIHQIFIFYFQNVVPSPVEAKVFIEQITTKLEKVRQLRGVCKESVSKYLYSKKTCIIESNIQQSFGVIQNITANCNQVLGVPKERLLKRYICDIMPEYFAKDHQLAITNWISKGTAASKMTDMIDFGYVDAKLNCFQGYLFLKMHSDGDKLFSYSTVIRQNDNDYILLNSRMEIEGIGKRLLREEIFVKDHVKHKINQYADISMEKVSIGSTFRTSILLQNLFNTPNLEQLYSQCQRHCNYDMSMLKFQCSIAITKYRICREEYYLIKFQNIKKWLSSARSLKDIKAPASIKDSKDGKTIITAAHLQYDTLLHEQYDSVDPMTNHIKYTQIFKAQTIKSSIHEQSSSEITFYSNFTLNVKKCFVNPSMIPMKFYQKMTIFLFVVCSLLMVQFFSLRTIFVVGFDSFNNVMFGDGAVSDNNQILEIMYNGVLMSKVYCQISSSSDRCKYLLNSTKEISNILYGLYIDNVEVFLKNRTALTNLKYYASYEVEIPFTVGSVTQNITTLQFMEYYYYAINKQHNLIESGIFSTPESKQTMDILIDNWPQMKFINHNAIYLYLDAGSKELDLLMEYLLILIAGISIFLLLLAAGLYYNDSYHYSQKFNILAIYGYMNAAMIKDLIDYYISLKESISTVKFRPCQMVDSSQETGEPNRKKMRYDKSSCCFVQIVALWIMLMIFAGLEILQVSLILSPCRNMVLSINNLMDSQNFMLEAYFQLKTYYLQSNYSKSVDQISSEISKLIDQPESDFTKTAKDSIDLFSSDPSFIEDFNNLLINDICTLTQLLFSPSAVNYCRNNFTYSTLSLGLVSSMTSFQRNTYTALIELQRRQKEAINKTDYFTRGVYQDIDDSIFYMFRLYQATQARMYEGLKSSVNKSLILLDLLNSCSVTVFLLLLGWWLWSFKGQRRALMQLYGAVLQFPETVMRKMVVSDVVTHLEMQF